MVTRVEGGVLAEALRHHGDAEAIRMGATSLTWSALAEASRRMRNALEGAGVERGDLVVVLAPPSLEGTALLFALLDLGAPMLPLNARLSEIEQAQAITETRARFLVVAPGDALGIRLAKETASAAAFAAAASSVSRRRTTPVRSYGSRRRRPIERTRMLALPNEDARKGLRSCCALPGPAGGRKAPCSGSTT